MIEAIRFSMEMGTETHKQIIININLRFMIIWIWGTLPLNTQPIEIFRIT